MKVSKEKFVWADHKKGFYFALMAAVISGFSIYINKFAIAAVPDSLVFTTVKNIGVALLLLACFMLPRALAELRRLPAMTWLKLFVIGVIGGSVPFLLFFYGLQTSSAASAAMVQKSLFVWVALFAVMFLGERIGRVQLTALGVLVGGNILLLGWPSSWAFGRGELLILAATFMWAIEAIIARKVMKDVSANVAAFGRMFFGAIVMLAYLIISGKVATLAVLDGQQFIWIAITAVLLLGYVTSYYAGLKYATASVVASVLVLGSVITSLLYVIFDAHRYSLEQVAGMVLIGAAVFILSRASRLTWHKRSLPVVTE